MNNLANLYKLHPDKTFAVVCAEKKCGAEGVVAEDKSESIRLSKEEEGWKLSKGKLFCPSCIADRIKKGEF